MNAIAPIHDAAISFGRFELFPARRLLAREGQPLRVGSRALGLLITLVENAGRVVCKNELMTNVWGGVIVEEANLRVQMSALRRLLEDDGLDSRYIVHVARRGYVFVAPVERRHCGFVSARPAHLASHAQSPNITDSGRGVNFTARSLR
jgi:DNA-binding winged helix-turn-helix (wHTH) protein